VQKVLDALVESAARLCDAGDAVIFRVFGEGLRLIAHHGRIPTPGPVGQFTIPLERGFIGPRAIIDRRPIHVADILVDGDEYPESQKRALRVGYRTTLVVPLIHAGEAIGVIMIRRAEVRPFTERQIELVNTFADQAVTAIENTRLFEEVQARTRELSDALEQQTATADVLRAISRSTFDLQVVLDTLIRAAAQLCGAKQAVLRRREGERYPLAATYGIKTEWLPLIAGHRNTPNRGSLIGRVALEERTTQIPDVFADPEFLNHETANTVGFRAIIGTPLLKDGEPIGFMSLHKETAGPFTAKQVQLFESFADQAVIAIENTRLFEQLQTRTSELAKTVEDLE